MVWRPYSRAKAPGHDNIRSVLSIHAMRAFTEALDIFLLIAYWNNEIDSRYPDSRPAAPPAFCSCRRPPGRPQMFHVMQTAEGRRAAAQERDATKAAP